MPVTIKRGEEQVAEGLTENLLGVQQEMAAPSEAFSDTDVREMMRGYVLELRALKQQMAAMGVNPAVAGQGATAVSVTPAVVAASRQAEEIVQQGDTERLRRAHAIELKVPIRIEPDDAEKTVYARRFGRWDHDGRRGPQPIFPPRRYQVNGVVIWLEVGRVIHVPESIGALHEQTMDTPQLDMIPAGEGRVGFWVGENPFGM